MLEERLAQTEIDAINNNLEDVQNQMSKSFTSPKQSEISSQLTKKKLEHSKSPSIQLNSS